jgi:hypothetical protein
VLGATRKGHVLVRYSGVTGFNNNAAAGFLDQATNVFLLKGGVRPSLVPTSPLATPS